MAGQKPPVFGNFRIWAKNLTDLALDLEKREGPGAPQVVEMEPEDHEKLNFPCDYVSALKIVKRCLSKKKNKKMNKNIIPPALHENSAKTMNRQEKPQQDTPMETDTEHLAMSTKTTISSQNEIASKSLKESHLIHTSEHDSISTNTSTPAASHLETSTSDSATVTSYTQQMTSAASVDHVTGSTPISDVLMPSATKGAPDQEDESALPHTLPKPKMDSAAGAEANSQTVKLENNVSAKKATAESSLPQTNISSAASASKTSALHHSQGNHLELNVNEASQLKNNAPLLRSESATPTPPQSPHIGLDQLLKVKCKEKRLVFCFACQTTLEGSSHLSSVTHQINCVKIKFPWWSAKPGEEELKNMVALLHNDEQASKVEAMKINVTIDVYKELKALPNDIALEKVRGFLKKKSSKNLGEQHPSAAISDASNTYDISTSPKISLDPSDVPDPEPGKEKVQTNPQLSSSVQPLNIFSASSSPNSPVQKPTSKVMPRVIKGSTTNNPSNLSRILTVKNTSVIGMSFVWECRMVPPSHPTFYLCESCSLSFSHSEICEHMVSSDHHLRYLMKHYPHFMYWVGENLLPFMSKDIIDDIAECVKVREETMDAQTVLLNEEYFKFVRTAPFSEALNVVRMIKQKKKTTILPVGLPSQPGVELSERQTTQPVSDRPSALTDDTAQMEISLAENTGGNMQSPYEDSSATTDSPNPPHPRPTQTDSISSMEWTDLRCFLPQSPTANFPTQPQSPFSPSNMDFAESPKQEKPEHFEEDDKAGFEVSVDATEKTSSLTLRDACTDDKPKGPDIQHDVASPVQENSATGPNLTEHAKTVEEDIMTEESLTRDHRHLNEESASITASTMVHHNCNESPALDPEDKAALDKHYCLLLIEFLKETKKNRLLMSSASQ